MTQVEHEIRRKKRVLEHAEKGRNICRTYRYFGIGRATV
jgi:hypothetical protein